VNGVAPKYIDSDGDGYEDPEPGPMPQPADTPPPGPAPDPAQLPVVVTVNIVGSSGTAAYAPNPATASMGNTLVWMNADLTTHNIVLNDGTIVGNLAPGQASQPIPLTSATVSFVCTIHPSMTGLVTDPSQIPPPASPTPPPDDYGYEDDYGYLRFTR
jgi:plastocyanin